jgi:hypothetical protein
VTALRGARVTAGGVPLDLPAGFAVVPNVEDGSPFVALGAGANGRSVAAYHRLDTSSGRLGRRPFVRSIVNDWNGTLPPDGGVDADAGDADADVLDAARDADGDANEAGAVDASKDAARDALPDAMPDAPPPLEVPDTGTDTGSDAASAAADGALAPTAGAPAAEGCACSAAGRARPALGALSLMLVPIALLRRRRRGEHAREGAER